MGTQIAQLKFFKWKKLSCWPKTNCNDEYWWNVDGLMRIRDAACMTCFQSDGGNCYLKSKGRAIIWRHLIKDSANSFWIYVCATKCSTSIPMDMQ